MSLVVLNLEENEKKGKNCKVFNSDSAFMPRHD